MLIIPIGKEKILRKFPWITFTLILINILVFIKTNEENKEYRRIYMEKQREVLQLNKGLKKTRKKTTTMPNAAFT